MVYQKNWPFTRLFNHHLLILKERGILVQIQNVHMDYFKVFFLKRSFMFFFCFFEKLNFCKFVSFFHIDGSFILQEDCGLREPRVIGLINIASLGLILTFGVLFALSAFIIETLVYHHRN